MLTESQKHELAHAFDARLENVGPDECPHLIFTEVTENDILAEFVRMGMDSLAQAAFLNSIGAMSPEDLQGVAEHALIMCLAFGLSYGKAEASFDMSDAADALDSLTGPDGIAWS